MDWRDAAQEKLKEVGDAIAQDVQVLLEGSGTSESLMVSMSDGSTRQLDQTEAQAL